MNRDESTYVALHELGCRLDACHLYLARRRSGAVPMKGTERNFSENRYMRSTQQIHETDFRDIRENIDGTN